MSTALSTSTAQSAAPAPTLPPPLSGRQKAAIIVQVLLSDGGKLSLSDLSDSLQTKLIHQMATLRHVDHATLQSVAQEFIDEFDAAGLSFHGALEGALTLLDGSISPETARRIRKHRPACTGTATRGSGSAAWIASCCCRFWNVKASRSGR